MNRQFVKNQKNKLGFTLIELLIVITIIGILAAAGLVSYSQATKKSRDAKRQSDLAKVQTALEMYRSNNTAYPQPSSSDAKTRFNIMKSTLETAGYLTNPNEIVDPTAGTTSPYSYSGLNSGKGYFMCAKLESISTGTVSNCNSSMYNYEVVNP